MISSNQIVINHNVFSSIIEFIESDKSISNIVIFTQSKIQKSEPDLLQNIQNKIKADIIILDEGENSKEVDRAMNSLLRILLVWDLIEIRFLFRMVEGRLAIT